MAQHSAAHHSTKQHSTAEYSAVQYSIWHGTTHRITSHHSTKQHSTTVVFCSPNPSVFQTDIDRQRFYTYAELLDLVKRSCSGLIKAGLKKGDVLGMYCPNIPEYAIIYLATLQAGGIVTTANPLYTEDELTHQLQTANAKYLVTIPSLAHRAKESAKNVGIDKVFVVGKTEGCLSLSELFKDDGSMYNTVNILPKEDVAVMPFSSGTTGFPKGVLLTHYNLIANACITTADGFISYSTSSMILGLLPFFHTYGMVTVLSVGLYRGSCVVCLPKFKRDKFFYILQGHEVSGCKHQTNFDPLLP